jgi:hypothetical protein
MRDCFARSAKPPHSVRQTDRKIVRSQCLRYQISMIMHRCCSPSALSTQHSIDARSFNKRHDSDSHLWMRTDGLTEVLPAFFDRTLPRVKDMTTV